MKRLLNLFGPFDDACALTARVTGTETAGLQQELKVGKNRDGEERVSAIPKGAGWVLGGSAR